MCPIELDERSAPSAGGTVTSWVSQLGAAQRYHLPCKGQSEGLQGIFV